jgi:hypothetical protein
MLKIPYGQSSFETVIEHDFFYQDRTEYIRKLEELNSRFLFYLRPRRFGKSLFITMLHSYYGLEHKEKFQKLFGHLDIGQHRTENANAYMVLSLEFSRISTKSEESTFDGFLSNIKEGIELFLQEYSYVFSKEITEEILAHKQPNDVIRALFLNYQKINQYNPLPKIYILIDEYDHFANELISFNYKYFATSVSQNGFVRKFYESIKTATRDSIVERLFVTGVSPITLDSLTSGFNISYNISLRPDFHEMMGFTEQEVEQILTKIDVKEDELEKALADLRAWYDGYLFNIKAENHIYNPDMVLFFAMQYQSYKEYPDDLLDPNIATDYSKIKNIFKIQNKESGNLEALKQLADEGFVEATLTPQFSLEKDFSIDDVISLLFYMGFLTIQDESLGIYKFAFPNFVIKRLYADYFVDMVKQQAALPIQNRNLHFALTDLGKYGNPEAFYKEVKEILTALSNRDMQGFSENSLKAIFISLLHQQKFYYIHSEYETKRTYVDIFLEGIKNYNVPFEVAFELKYAKISENINIESELDKAETQLLNYLHSKKFNERPNVKAFVVLVHGLTIHSREIDIL